RRVLRKCRGRPRVLVDGGPWYRWALDSLGLPWEHVTFGERNPVEQWFGILKQRIKRFYRRWPHNATIAQAQLWIESFVALYHIKRLPEALS
ncbi:MAG: IS6 family transposase, partial [Candidatus Thorarchaeota archaeon]